MDGGFLQLFLLANAVLVGAVVAVAIQHAIAHFKPHQHDKPVTPIHPTLQLPNASKERLVREAEANFLAELNRSTGEFQRDLQATSAQLSQQLGQLGSEIIIAEKGRYTTMLEDIRKQTEAALAGAQAEIAQHQAELKAMLAKEQETLSAAMSEKVKAEQELLIKQIDTKLADAMASFLTEALKHNVDLGAQSTYLTSLLEQHKDDFKREVSGGDPTAK